MMDSWAIVVGLRPMEVVLDIQFLAAYGACNVFVYVRLREAAITGQVLLSRVCREDACQRFHGYLAFRPHE